MIRVGLTGGIGAGKSSVASMLVELGAVLVDADAIARELMEPGQEVLAKTVEAFGPSILDAEGRLQRAALAALVFGDEAARQTLNEIVHPAVRQRSAELVAQAVQEPGFSGVVVEDIPLLVETGQAERFDGVLVVEAELEVRLDRLVGLRGMAREDALARMAAQASDEERRAVATWLVDNSGSLSETQVQVERIWAEIQALQGRS